MEATFTPHSPDDRTPEQQALKRRQHRERRARNQAGRRRARRREWPTRHGPPAPGYISRAWRLAEERYLHRYGLPLPDNWHARPRPQIPKLNTGGDHHHPLAMHTAQQTANDSCCPIATGKTRWSRHWRWNWKPAKPRHPSGNLI